MNPNPISAQCLSLPISVTATSSTSAALPAIGTTIRFLNEGPNVCFVSIGVGSQTATLPNATVTATSFPVPVGDSSFTIPYVAGLHIAAICRASQTATLTANVGEGV